jgi:MarR family 2-MHQ and catechol resistance regulon transcriptional repressor
MTSNTSTATLPAMEAEGSADERVMAERMAALTEEQQRALGFWVKLARAHNAISQQATADISRHGLTLAEFGILEALYHRGPMLLGEVQKRILVSSGGITFLVDRLTAKGLVERRACDADKRARYATLTEQGVRLVAEIFPVHADAIVRAVGALSESELDEASRLMRKVGLAASNPEANSGE